MNCCSELVNDSEMITAVRKEGGAGEEEADDQLNNEVNMDSEQED